MPEIYCRKKTMNKDKTKHSRLADKSVLKVVKWFVLGYLTWTMFSVTFTTVSKYFRAEF
jgi:hypothetical protein